MLPLWALSLAACASGDGEPPDRPAAGQPLASVAVFELPPVDVDALKAEDAENEAAGKPPRFAAPVETKVGPQSHGTWEDLADGQRMWRLRIRSEGALSLNLGFGSYHMPPKGRLSVYTPDRRTVHAFTAEDNEGHGQLWTPVVPGDELVVELALPAEQMDDLRLELIQVGHGYKPLAQASD